MLHFKLSILQIYYFLPSLCVENDSICVWLPWALVAVQGLFCSWGEWGLLTAAASLVVEQQALEHVSFVSCGAMGLVTPWHVRSSQTGDRTCVLCIGRWILNCWTTREV